MKSFTTISHEQRKKIYALAHKAGLSNGELHDYLPSWAGCTSLSAREGGASSAQADKIIKALLLISNANPPLRGGRGVIEFRPPKQGDEASYEQLSAIAEIQKSLGWNDARTLGFIRHTAKCKTIGDLSVKTASMVIVGLKRMGYTKLNAERSQMRNQKIESIRT